MQQTIATSEAADQTWQQQNERKPSDLVASIAAIERSHATARQRAGALLDVIAESLGCLSGCLTVGIASDEIDLHRESSIEGVAAWSDTLRSTALEARSHARSITRLFGPDSTPQFAVIASPIDIAGRDPFGAIAVLVRCNSNAQAERLQLHLRAACLQIASVLTRRSTPKPGVEMSDIARVFTRAGSFKNIHEFAYTITNSARQRFDCDQAAMGTIRNGKVRVMCISGLDEVKRRSPGVHQIEQAMGECADAGRAIVAQPRDQWEDSDLADEGLLHQRWRATAAGACVLSIPVDDGNGPAAVVSFRRSADRPFDADDIEAAQRLLAPLAGAIPLVSRATQPLSTHTAHSLRSAATWSFGKGTLRRKALVLLAIAAIVWIAIGTRPYRISVPAVVTAEREHVVAAPIEGTVATVLVRAGDQVEPGQIIATMDRSAHELERRGLEAEMQNARLRVAEAIAARDPAGASLAQGELRSLQTRLDRVLEQITHSEIRAPVGGIVIAPDLSNLPGRVLALGDPMISIAAADAFTLELRVPQSRITDLAPGSRLRFASHARPEDPGFSALDRVAPATVQREGRAVFIAEAKAPEGQDWLRPGMEGVAMIDAGDRPNWWIAAHRLIDNARLRFWFD
ncbi:MAG: efflux RND transporter periplasmic adaptor subunit [Phycisphaerales bacterium JB041]